jgi:hypothetical protein
MGFIKDAQRRGRRRKSPWNLLLIPTVLGILCALWWSTAMALGQLHRAVYPTAQPRILPDGLSGIAMAVAPLFAWLGPSFILSNLLVAAVPAARRALDREATSVPGSDLRTSNRGLIDFSKVMFPAALLVGLLDAATSC